MATNNNNNNKALLNTENKAQENIYLDEKRQGIDALEEITTPGFVYDVEIDNAYGDVYTNKTGDLAAYINLRFQKDPSISAIAFMDKAKFDFALNHNRFFKEAKDPYRDVLTLYDFSNNELKELQEQTPKSNVEIAFKYELKRLNAKSSILDKSLGFFADSRNPKKRSAKPYEDLLRVQLTNNGNKFVSLFSITSVTRDVTWFLVYRKVMVEMYLKNIFKKPSELLNLDNIKTLPSYNKTKAQSLKNFDYKSLVEEVGADTTLDDLKYSLAKREIVEKTSKSVEVGSNEQFLRWLKERLLQNDMEEVNNTELLKARFYSINSVIPEVSEYYNELVEGKPLILKDIDDLLATIQKHRFAKSEETKRNLYSAEVNEIIAKLQINTAYNFFDSILDGIRAEFNDYANLMNNNADRSGFESKYDIDNALLETSIKTQNIPNVVFFDIITKYVKKVIQEYYSDLNFNDATISKVLSKEQGAISSFVFKVAIVHYQYTMASNVSYTTKIHPINIYERSRYLNFRRLNGWNASINGQLIYAKDSSGNDRTYVNKNNETVKAIEKTYSSIVPYDYYNRKDRSDLLFEKKKKDLAGKKAPTRLSDKMNELLEKQNENDIRDLVTQSKLKLNEFANEYDQNITIKDRLFQNLFSYTADFVNTNHLLEKNFINMKQPTITKASQEDISKFETVKNDAKTSYEPKTIFDDEDDDTSGSDWVQELQGNKEEKSEIDDVDAKNPIDDDDDLF